MHSHCAVASVRKRFSFFLITRKLHRAIQRAQGCSWRRTTIETWGWVHPHTATHLSDPFNHACLGVHILSSRKTEILPANTSAFCGRTRASACARLRTKLTPKILPYSIIISSPLCPADAKQSSSRRFVQGYYNWSFSLMKRGWAGGNTFDCRKLLAINAIRLSPGRLSPLWFPK